MCNTTVREFGFKFLFARTLDDDFRDADLFPPPPHLQFYEVFLCLPENNEAASLGCQAPVYMWWVYSSRATCARLLAIESVLQLRQIRSEERRVGKECRSRWSPYH